MTEWLLYPTNTRSAFNIVSQVATMFFRANYLTFETLQTEFAQLAKFKVYSFRRTQTTGHIRSMFFFCVFFQTSLGNHQQHLVETWLLFFLLTNDTVKNFIKLIKILPFNNSYLREAWRCGSIIWCWLIM